MKVRQLKILAQRLIDQYRVSKRRACQVIKLHRSAMYYIKRKRDDEAIRKRITEIAQTFIRYGFQRIHTLLRREGWKDNLKRVYSIYKEEGLNLRTKRRRRNKSAAHRLELPELTGPFRVWSMDFVADQVFDGRKFRALTIEDNFSRYCYAILIGQSIKGIDVVHVMEELKMKNKTAPKRIQVDNGSEFIWKDFDRWAYKNHITLDYSRPGKPTDNPFIESFNGSLRDECLNINFVPIPGGCFR